MPTQTGYAAGCPFEFVQSPAPGEGKCPARRMRFRPAGERQVPHYCACPARLTFEVFSWDEVVVLSVGLGWWLDIERRVTRGEDVPPPAPELQWHSVHSCEDRILGYGDKGDADLNCLYLAGRDCYWQSSFQKGEKAFGILAT